jgi:hypothetical protein
VTAKSDDDIDENRFFGFIFIILHLFLVFTNIPGIFNVKTGIDPMQYGDRLNHRP